MTENWRAFLYFPLGLIPSLFFASRVLVQWYQTEKKRESQSSPLFWKLSFMGNVTLILHYLVQVQFHLAVFQGLNAVISWRNLDIIKNHARMSRKGVLTIAFLVFLLVTGLFLVQSYFIIGYVDWIRSPRSPFVPYRLSHALGWHVLGTLGSAIFGCRFWVQWWLAEKSGKSKLGPLFWRLSVVGSSLLIIYAARIGDQITLFYNLFGIIPSLRNLYFLQRARD